jgi:hypothetical protein
MQDSDTESSACMSCGAALPFFVSPRPDVLPSAHRVATNFEVLGRARHSDSAGAQHAHDGARLPQEQGLAGDAHAGAAAVAAANTRLPDAGKE